jgi:hypothetical protein
MKSEKQPAEKFEKIFYGTLFFVPAICMIAVIISAIKYLPIFVSAGKKVAAADIATPIVSVPDYGENPQFAVFSFDGSKSIDMWEETRGFAKEMNSQGKPIKFTYFISGVYLLENQNKNNYLPPNYASGTSLIGFGGTQSDVGARISQINQAIAEGHEIGSHENGHFNGWSWSLENWKQELSAFGNLVFNTDKNNSDISQKINLKLGEIIGSRTPELAVNQDYYQALAESGYRYDAGKISNPNIWPKKNKFGVWEFPLGGLTLKSGEETISMDYNIFSEQSDAKDGVKKGSPMWNEMYQETLGAYKNYFNSHYNGNRSPIYIANHFSKWNDGVYWEAMKNFASEICGKSDVKCITYKELANYLDSKSK